MLIGMDASSSHGHVCEICRLVLLACVFAAQVNTQHDRSFPAQMAASSTARELSIGLEIPPVIENEVNRLFKPG